MNERQGRGGPGLLPFLLIPATFMAVKAMHRHRAMRSHGWGPGGFGPEAFGPGRSYGRHGWHGAPDAEGEFGTEGQASFRLPPRIESHLNAWHDQAHKATDNSATGAARATGEGPAA